MGPTRGEMWWAEEPEIGRRPVLVLTRARAIEVLTWVLVAPATRSVRGIPTEVGLNQEDGMPEVCALTLDNVRPLRKSLLTNRISSLAPEKMDEVCRALATAVDC